MARRLDYGGGPAFTGVWLAGLAPVGNTGCVVVIQRPTTEVGPASRPTRHWPAGITRVPQPRDRTTVCASHGLRYDPAVHEGCMRWRKGTAAAGRRSVRVHLSEYVHSDGHSAGPEPIEPLVQDEAGRLQTSGDDDDVAVRKGEIVMSTRGDKGANAVFRLPAEMYGHDRPSPCPLDLEVEWFDDEGGGQICYVPAWEENYKIHASYSLSGSKTWKATTYSIADARTDGKLWHGDVGIYFHYRGKNPLRIRRTKVTMGRPECVDAAKERCRGDLDHLGDRDGARGVQLRPAADLISSWAMALSM